MTAAGNAVHNPAPGLAKTWTEFWTTYVAGLRKFQENPQRHIDFIVALRREAKLPDFARKVLNG